MVKVGRKKTVIIAAVLILSGCASAPGHYLSERNTKVDRTESGYASKEEIKIIPVTAKIISKFYRPVTVGQPKQNLKLESEKRAFEYRVGPQDVLSVTVWDHPELTIPAGEYRPAELAGHLVNSSGKIFFPYAGEIKVAGLTETQIRKLISQRIKKFIVKPQLDVRVVAYRSQQVHVVGEVNKTGLVPVTDVPLTLVDAIDQAGGYTKEADLENVTVTRDGSIRKFDLLALYDGGDTSQNMLLKHGDIVHVPDRSQKKVYVLGEVKRPTAYLMHKGRMTLAEAIGNAEGFDPNTANPGKIYVIRGTREGAKIYWLDARSPDTLLLSTQFALAPQDVVYISTASVSRWNRVISQILPSVQLLWQTKSLLE
jgi:polysaccharide export outer membrane protein